MAEHDDLDRQLAALTPQPVQLEDSGEGQVEERKSHGPVSPPSADSEKSCSRYPDDIFGTHRRPELEKRCPNGLRRARGVAGGDDEVGFGRLRAAPPTRSSHPGPSSRAFPASARSYVWVLSTRTLEFCRYPAVGEGGLEPPHPFGHRNLNPARLPIPPLARATGRGYPKIQTPVIKELLGPRPTKCSNAPLNPPSGTLCRPWRATNGPERESLETISLPVPPTRG